MSDWREPQSGSEAPGWLPAGAAPVPPPTPYLRLAGLSAWIFWLLLVMAATYAVTTALTLVARGVSGYSTPARIDRFGGTDVALSLIGVVQSALSLAAAVLFIIWFYRAYENLRPLAAAEPRRSSGWTIGAWFVPILDLVLPKLMLNETWRGSDPDLARPREVRIPAFHHLWWAIWVAAFVLSIVAGVEIGISSFRSGLLGGDTTAVSATSAALLLLSGVLNAVAAALGALVVRRTTERQEIRRERLAAARPAEQGLAR